MADEVTIYVQLLNEGIDDVWRPVKAIHERDDIYRIVSVNSRDDETWEYQTGSLVHCTESHFYSGRVALAAISPAQ